MTKKMLHSMVTIIVALLFNSSLAQDITCTKHDLSMALVHLKTCSIQEPQVIQEKLLKGSDFCDEVNELLLRCVSPVKGCFQPIFVTEIAHALMHDVIPLNKPKLFQRINPGNCSLTAKQYAAKPGQPKLQSKVCNFVESWENRFRYSQCKEHANELMKEKLAQFRGQREKLMLTVCKTVDQLLGCGRLLHRCLTSSEIELINSSLLDNLEELLSNLEAKTGFHPSTCKAFEKDQRLRPIQSDPLEEQSVRLASPSLNVLDFSSRARSFGLNLTHSTPLTLALVSLYALLAS